MGGRGSSSKGITGGGGNAASLKIKSEVGQRRDFIRDKIRNVFKSEFYYKKISEKLKIKVKLKSKTFTHLSNDILKKGVIKDHNIKRLEKQFKSSYLKETSPSSKDRKDNKDKFYYYKAKGKKLYFNVAREKTVLKNKKVRYDYVLYSITNKIR